MNNKSGLKTFIAIVALWAITILSRVVIRFWMGTSDEPFTETLLWGTLQSLFIIPLYFILEYINKIINKKK